jgi:hypothetical protein
MFPRIAWELVAGPLVSTEHTLGTNGLEKPTANNNSLVLRWSNTA